MRETRKDTIRCPICQEEREARLMIPHDAVEDAVAEVITEQHPKWQSPDILCTSCFAEAVSEHLRRVQQALRDAYALQKQEMRESLRPFASISDVNEELHTTRSLGERISDATTTFVGSWAFFVTQLLLLVAWVSLNTVALVLRHFDPYPYILLNLVFSLWGSLEVPLVMMSQNRQDAHDRLRNANDYRVNRRAELEVQHINRKLDQLLSQHWPQLLEIQQWQMEIMQRLGKK
ncbi:MAG TPA: DUF1003 domain-containing protein [Armatimonadota bacterium]|jgi:uncharacterized membrane protein